MPVRGSYNISGAGEATEEVPRSSPREKYWILKLVTFIVLSIVIVTLCLIWSQSNNGETKDRYETAKQVSSASEQLPGVSDSSGNNSEKSQLKKIETVEPQLDNTTRETQTPAENHPVMATTNVNISNRFGNVNEVDEDGELDNIGQKPGVSRPVTPEQSTKTVTMSSYSSGYSYAAVENTTIAAAEESDSSSSTTPSLRESQDPVPNAPAAVENKTIAEAEESDSSSSTTPSLRESQNPVPNVPAAVDNTTIAAAEESDSSSSTTPSLRESQDPVPDAPAAVDNTTIAAVEESDSSSSTTPSLRESQNPVPNVPAAVDNTTIAAAEESDSSSSTTPSLRESQDPVPDAPAAVDNTTIAAVEESDSSSSTTPSLRESQDPVPDAPAAVDNTTIAAVEESDSSSSTTPSLRESQDPVPDAPAAVDNTTIAAVEESDSSSSTTPSLRESQDPVPDAPAAVDNTTIAAVEESDSSSSTTPSLRESQDPVPDAPAAVDNTTIAAVEESDSSSSTTPSLRESQDPVPDAPAAVDNTTIAAVEESDSSSSTTPSLRESQDPVPDAPAAVDNTTIAAVEESDSSSSTTPSLRESQDPVPNAPAAVENTTIAAVEESDSSSSTTPSLRESQDPVPDAPAAVDNTTIADVEDIETFKGRQLASKMIFYMNHSAKPCEDFYEYACGNFENNQIIAGSDLQQDAIRRIFDEAEKHSERPELAPFIKYYRNCISYEKNPNQTEKIIQAKKALTEIGKFYSRSETMDNFDITDILSKLLFRNSAPLFDITLDVSASDGLCDDLPSPASFTLKLGPSDLADSFFMQKQAQDCYNEQKLSMKKEDVDLAEQYLNSNHCRKTILANYLASVKEALKMLNVDTEVVTQTANELKIALLQPFYWQYGDKRNTKTTYAKRDYSRMTIVELQRKITPSFLNWKRLIRIPEDETLEIQVYFKNVVFQGLESLSKNANKRELNNALLAIYAHKVYQELVLEHPDVDEYCKQLTTSLMKPHASMLYMSSFGPEDLEAMNATVIEMFTELKKTFESGLIRAKWQTDVKNSNLMKKLRGLSIALPQKSNYLDNWSVELTGNHFEDTITLQKNYRTSMYQLLLNGAEIKSEQIWAYFASPYQATSLAIHGLNKIVVPYAAIDWPTVWSAKTTSSKHMITATLGTLIAREIAHHFDLTGIKFLNGHKATSDDESLFCDDDQAFEIFKKYIENVTSCPGTSGNVSLPTTGQTIQYQIQPLSENSRVADAIGLQLAYDTMQGLSSAPKNNLLPWLSNQDTNEDKQFFLAYAQLHCSKIPLTSSFVSLFEDENLPSRLRILIAASNNNLLGSAWNCPTGSNVHPEEVSSIFPKLVAAPGTVNTTAQSVMSIAY
ncbi:uncharacterized protein LOC105683899 isoform X2 [Athalia rosae]|uniref:uncharacterized protein LOC105683899 isoform X2 n=1 Tax=Athalia rosae TaxID=37344 RepID=UPI002034A570|nr:uncharacterized protein LOC105683899 isoform X2 [Athalia rosae]